jgi:hypothetical protein
MNQRTPSATRIGDVIKLLPKNLLSLTVFKWTIPISLALSVVSTPEEVSSVGELFIWLFIGLSGHLAMLPFVLYGKDKPFGEQVLLVLLMGITRGGVGGILAPLFGVADSLPLLSRILNSALAVFYWNQAGSVIVEYGQEFRAKLRTLLNEVMEKNLSGFSMAAQKSSNQVVGMVGALQEKISHLVGQSPTRDDLNRASQEIDSLITDYIKPLSQSKWRDGELIWLRAGFLSVLKRVLTQNPIPVSAVILLTWPFTLVVQISRIGLAETALVQLTWTSMVLLAAKIIYRKEATQGSYSALNQAFLASLPFIYAITFLIQLNSPFNPQPNLSAMVSGYLISAITQITLFIIGSLLLALRNDQEFVFSFISDVIKAGELESLLQKTNSGAIDANYAQYLHAEVQSQLLACKLLLLKAAESEFELFPPEITRQIVERMEQLKVPYERPAARIPAKRVAELSKSWEGLAEITYSLSPEFAELHAYSDITSQLIEESVVNSIRHGKATQICITGTSKDGLIYVEVGDNGQVLEHGHHRGLGTILFDTFTKSWSLQRTDSATVLSFVMEPEKLGSRK